MKTKSPSAKCLAKGLLCEKYVVIRAAGKVAGALGVGVDVVRRALAALGSEQRRRDADLDGDTAELAAMEIGRTLEVVRAVKAARVVWQSEQEKLQAQWNAEAEAARAEASMSRSRRDSRASMAAASMAACG